MKITVVLILVILLLEGCDLFSPDEKVENYVVKVEADSGVTVFPQIATVHQGEEVTFTYTIKEGYVLESITVNGVSITPVSNSFSVIANSDQTVRVTTKEKPKFIISASAGLNGTISPSGEVKVIEGKNQKFSIIPNVGFLVDTLRIDGQEIVPSVTYTFYDVSSNKKIEVTFKKDSILWPLLNIEWSRDSVYIDDNKYYEPGKEIINFYPGGRYTKLKDNILYEWTDWALDKNKTPVLLFYGGRSCVLELINGQKLILSHINEYNQKVTLVFSNHGYKN
jgi:hypothetical protein